MFGVEVTSSFWCRDARNISAIGDQDFQAAMAVIKDGVRIVRRR